MTWVMRDLMQRPQLWQQCREEVERVTQRWAADSRLTLAELDADRRLHPRVIPSPAASSSRTAIQASGRPLARPAGGRQAAYLCAT